MRRDTPAVALAGLLFLLSGAAALVYQVAWQRLLALHSGVGLYSVAMIVAAFMAGLGIGSHLGGRLSARLTPRRALRVFAALELGIGAFGAASPWLYYDWLYPLAVRLPSPSWQAGLLHLAGAPAPDRPDGDVAALPRARGRDGRRGREPPHRLALRRQRGRRGRAGPSRTPWLLLPALGVRGAVLAAASANLAVGLGALGARSASAPLRPSSGRPTATDARGPRAPKPPAAGRFRSGSGSTRCRASWRCRSRSSGSGCWTSRSSPPPSPSARVLAVYLLGSGARRARRRAASRAVRGGRCGRSC